VGFSGEIGHIEVVPDAEADLTRADLAPDVDDVARRAHAQDPATLDALAETGRWLGRGAALLANVFNPEVVILGGCFARPAPWLLPRRRPNWPCGRSLRTLAAAASCRPRSAPSQPYSAPPPGSSTTSMTASSPTIPFDGHG